MVPVSPALQLLVLRLSCLWPVPLVPSTRTTRFTLRLLPRLSRPCIVTWLPESGGFLFPPLIPTSLLLPHATCPGPAAPFYLLPLTLFLLCFWPLFVHSCSGSAISSRLYLPRSRPAWHSLCTLRRPLHARAAPHAWHFLAPAPLTSWLSLGGSPFSCTPHTA